MKQELRNKLNRLIQCSTGIGTHCVLSLIDLDGSPTASTITAAKADGLKWIAFCTGLRGPKAERIKKCGRAGVCFNGDFNISLVGSIEILTDPETKREMWYDGLRNHFSGPEDPDYCVLRFRPERCSVLLDGEEFKGDLPQD